MFGVIAYLIVLAVARCIRRKRRAPVARGLCADCTFAHIQYGANAKVATFCTFGGGVRWVALNVLYCTDYRDRNLAPHIVPIGFVRAFASAEAEVASSVPGRKASSLPTQHPPVVKTKVTSKSKGCGFESRQGASHVAQMAEQWTNTVVA
jgi:hypothetical protein